MVGRGYGSRLRGPGAPRRELRGRACDAARVTDVLQPGPVRTARSTPLGGTPGRRTGVFLLAVTAWTVLIWVVLIKNIAQDHTHGTAFHVVHDVLAVISLALAAGTGWVGLRLLRRL